MAQHSRTAESDRSRTDSGKNVLPRRSYMRSLAAVATTALALGPVGAAADDDYEVVEARGQEVAVESGSTLENVLFDLTTGEDLVVMAYGTDWTIRNVGFYGMNTSGAGTTMFGVADTGDGESTIENVYLGDGSDAGNANGRGHGQTAIWVSPDHDGHLDVRNVNIQGFADNAIYASAPGNGGGGTVHVDECFAANCGVSHYRLATAGSRVTDSSVVVDGDGFVGRGVWAWAPGTVEVENCQLETGGESYAVQAGANGSGTTVVLSDSDYDDAFQGGIEEVAGATVRTEDVGTDPEPTVPDDVPESAEDAAAGRSD